MNKWKRLAECLFRLFDPSDSPMEEEISTTGSTDFEEILILIRQIGLWKSNSVPKIDLKEFTFRHHATRISASISIFYSVAHPSDFPFSTVQCILMHMFGTRLNDFCPRDFVIIEWSQGIQGLLKVLGA